MNPASLPQLIKNCRTKHGRTVGRPPDCPSDWCPHKIQNPDAPQGYMFTNESAWCFIADRLASGHQYELIVLEQPKGEIAVVMEIVLPQYSKKLYVKIQVGRACCAIGRSFHISYN